MNDYITLQQEKVKFNEVLGNFRSFRNGEKDP